MKGYLIEHESRVYSPDGVSNVAPEDVEAHNLTTQRAEVAAFRSRAADRWFAYVHCGPTQPQRITTWMGHTLATVTWVGARYKCPSRGYFPSERQNFRAKGIDGREWSGTYYVSSGNYCRMRVVKGGAR